MVKYCIFLAFIVSLLTLAGCSEPQVISPFSKQPVTASALQREVDVAASERELAITRAAKQQEAELKQLQREASTQLAKLDLSQQSERIDITSSLDARIAEIESKYASQAADADRAWKLLESRFADATEDIQRQYESRAAGLSIVKAGIQAFPASAPFAGLLDNPALLALLGIGGGYAVRSRMKKAEDKAWDEAEAKADIQAKRRDETWDQAEQAALLKSLIATATEAKK
jgi:hypothetical protein